MTFFFFQQQNDERIKYKKRIARQKKNKKNTTKHSVSVWFFFSRLFHFILLMTLLTRTRIPFMPSHLNFTYSEFIIVFFYSIPLPFKESSLFCVEFTKFFISFFFFRCLRPCHKTFMCRTQCMINEIMKN